MALQLTGMRFVNQGLNQTIAGINQYNTAVNRMAQTVTTATQHINRAYSTTTSNVTNNLNNVGNVVNNFARSTSTAHGHILRFGEGLKKLIITMTGFYILKRIINSVLDAFSDLFRKMVQGASDTQLLIVRFENLVAISNQATGNFNSYADALAASKEPAKDLLEWVNLLAVKTRFGRDEIGGILSLGMAFDLTAGQAKTLTTAVVDWASGMGLEQDALQRMVVNFGQMMRMGKITQRELRDLAIGGLFPVNDALKRIGEKAGFTGDALAKFMQNTATSGVPVNALLTEFVQIAEERFPKAGERMARTWDGVSQNIKDFVTTIAGAAVLGPTMDKIVGRLSDTLDNALSPSVRAAAREIGERLLVNLEKIAATGKNVAGMLGDLARAFGIPIPSAKELIAMVDVMIDKITTGLDDAVDSVKKWLSSTGQTFAAGAQEFFRWGFELIAQFGIGMLKGITTVLVVVMNTLASFLSLMLQPFSPPKIAPHIDVWGKETMNQYLKGMTKADFGMLANSGEDIQNALDKAMPRALTNRERSREREDTSAILGITAGDLANLAANVGAELNTSMSSAMESWGTSAMNSYLKGMTNADFDILKDLQGTIKSALDVMASLGTIAKESVGAVFADISKQLIIAMHQLEKTGKVSEAVFKAIAKAGGELGDELAELARRQFALLKATKELEAAQRALTEAQTADTAAKGRVDELIRQYRDLVDAGSSKDILNAKRAEIKAAMDERQKTRESVSLAEDRVEKAEDILDPLRDAVQLQEKMVEQMIALAQAQVKVTTGGGGIEDIAESFGKLGDALKEATEDMDWLKVKTAIDQVKFENDINAMVTRMNVKLGELFAPITDKWDKEVRPSIDNLVEAFNKLSDPLNKLQGTLSGDGILTKIAEIAGAFVGLRISIGLLVRLLGPRVGGALGGALGGPWGLALTVLAAGIISVKDEIPGLLDNLSDSRWKLPGWLGGGTVDLSFIDKIKEFGNSSLDPDDYNSIPSKVGRLFADIDLGLDTWFDKNLVQPIENAIDEAKKKWNYFWDNPLLALGVMGEGGKLASIKIPGLSDLPTLIDGWLGEAKQKVTDFFTGEEGITTKIVTWLGGVWTEVSNWFTTLLSEAGVYQFVDDFVTAGEDLITGLIKGVQNMIAPFISSILDPINAVLEAIGMEPIKINLQPETDLDDLENWDKGGHHAQGGLVTRKGLYTLAEHGPEMVIPAGLTSSFLKSVRAMKNDWLSAGQRIYAGPRVAAPSIYNSRSNVANKNYNLSVNSARSSKSIIRDFSIMETLAG